MTVEASKKIRALLAEAGYGKADVSVYNKSYSMGSTVYVTIKRAEIPLGAVEKIASAGERIDRDESGEILGGGNCFVDTRYGDGVLDELAARINEQFTAGRRGFGPITLEPGRDPWTLRMVSDGKPGLNVDAKAPGDVIARALAADSWLAAVDDDDAETLSFYAHVRALERERAAREAPANDAAPANDDPEPEPFARLVAEAAALSPAERQALIDRINAAAAALSAPSAAEVADALHGALEPRLLAAYFGAEAKPADITREGATVTLAVAGGVYRISVERTG